MIGSKLIRLATVDSTNSYAAEIGRDPDSHGTVVVADVQTAGRGQYGRTWSSEVGDSLLVSVVLKPPPILRRPVVLIAWAAVAVGDAIFSLTGIQTRIKWPNDLLVRGQKVCGILTEAANDTVIVGIGLNFNQTRQSLNERGLREATSLRVACEAGPSFPPCAEVALRSFDRDDVLAVVIRQLNQEWLRLNRGELAPVEVDWKRRIDLLGRVVRAERHDGTTATGRLMDMGFDGIEIATETGGVEVLVPEIVKHLRVL